MPRLSVEWDNPDYYDVLSIQQGDRVYYHPHYLRAVNVGLVRRVLNEYFGIYPFKNGTDIHTELQQGEIITTRMPHSFDSDAED